MAVCGCRADEFHFVGQLGLWMRSQGALCIRIRRSLLDEEAVSLMMIE